MMPENALEIPTVDDLLGGDGGQSGAERDEHGQFGRIIAVAIVLTTLIAALVAFAQACALRVHDEADAAAERYGSLALSANAIEQGKAQTQLDRFNLLSQQLEQANNASLFEELNPSKAMELTARRWSRIAKHTESDTVAIARAQGTPYVCSPTAQKSCPGTDAFYSPAEDPAFPERYEAQAAYNGDRFSALRDGANQRAQDAETKFVYYAAALTMLAIAAFLFGYSLTPHKHSRKLLYSRVAVAFVATAVILSLYQALAPIDTSPKSAADAYASGQVAFADSNDAQALADFNRAISQRPRFVNAYFERAQVELDMGLPHVGSGSYSYDNTANGVTLPSISALDRAVADLQRAHNEGSDSPTLLYELGNLLMYRGLIMPSSGELRQSHLYAEQAVQALKEQPNVGFVLGNALFVLAEDDLVAGDPSTGREYAAALDEMRSSSSNALQVDAAALTDLNLIESTHPALAAKVAVRKSQIVTQEETYYEKGKPHWTTPDGTAPSNDFANHLVRFSEITLEPDPGHALVRFAGADGFDPSKDLLSVQWAYKDPVDGEWAVLPQISGPIGNELVLNSDGTYSTNNPSYLSFSIANREAATCLPPGAYRVELYVNGHLAGIANTDASWPPLQGVRLTEVQSAICAPVGWTSLPGLGPGTDSYVAPDLSAGTVLFRIPAAAARAYVENGAVLEDLMNKFVRPLGNELLPGLHPVLPTSSTGFFMSSSNGKEREWKYKNGVAYSGVGAAANGQVYIGVAWSHTENLARYLFLSFSPL